jgi:alginate O-acetyltransferase complex protein AlgI
MPIFDLYLGILLAATLIIYRLLPSDRSRILAVCACSTGCLLYLSLSGLVLAVTLGAFTYIAAVVLRSIKAKGIRRVGMGLTIAILLSPLLYMKYWNLFLSSVGILAGHNIVPPLGISFLTFRLIAYLVDQNLPRAERPGLPRYALFVLFFPTFIAGPIERWVTFHRGPSIELRKSNAGAALERILYGVAKKVILADWLAWYALRLDSGPLGPTVLGAWLLPVVYSWQIYLDFAAYSDISIGLGRLFGYDIMENFNRPFRSHNMAEFWRRWHISLSEWIRIYLFMPMATRRPSALRLHAAVMVSMALCGLWHGAGLNFVFWGVFHGIGISAHHLWRALCRRSERASRISQMRGIGPLSIASTYIYVNIGFLFFFKPVPDAILVIRRMFGAG